MTTRASVISTANTAVEALPTITRTTCRSGAGQFFASEVTSIRARIAAPAASAKPVAARIRPSCR